MKYNSISLALVFIVTLMLPSTLLAEGNPLIKGAAENPSDNPSDSTAVANTWGDTPGAVMFSELPDDGVDDSADADDEADSVPDEGGSDAHGASSAAASAAGSLVGTSAAGFLLDKSVGDMDSNLLKPLNVIGKDFITPVEKNIQMYTGGLRKHFTRYLSRSGKYMDMMKGIFRENGLPEDLVFLAMVESGFNPMAYSWARASGPWQFIKGTGKKYGLNVTPWVDERRDPVKSTKAAANYLKDLYDMFGSWALALASYNAGEGSVSRAVLRNGTLDFWELRKSGSLADETKEYVPKFLAAKIIATNPKAYGFDGLVYEQPMEFDSVEVDASTRLETAAKCCGSTVAELKELNPELMRWCTPPNNPSYTLRIPKGTKEAFLLSYNGLAQSDKTGPAEYIVKRGDTLKGIARRFHASAYAVAQLNGIGSRGKVRPGQSLLLPAGAAVTEAAYSSEDASDDTSDSSDDSAGGGVKPSRHTVKEGETLSSIAKKYKMSVTALAKINGIGSGDGIQVGQKLVLSGSRARASNKGRRRHAHRRVRAA